MNDDEIEFDVIIVGAGLSGLVSAYQILKKESTLKVLILEQNSCIGGQILTLTNNQNYGNTNDDDDNGIELGAKWFNADQYHIVNLCKQLNVPILRKEQLSENLIRLWDIDRDRWSLLAKFELKRFLKYLDLISIKYYPGNNIEINRSITMETFICKRLLFNSARNVIRILVRVSTGRKTHQISLDEYLTICNGTYGATNQLNWKLFFICMTPAILNGLHVSSYVFLGQMPENLTCIIPTLMDSNNWNYDLIKNVSTRSIDNKCNIRNLNYDNVSQLTNYDDIMNYVDSQPIEEIGCLSMNNNYFYYDNREYSIVPEWDLICDREVLRSTVQVALALGKFIGAFIFGIISDRFGRKTSVTISSVLYMISGPVAAFTNEYIVFLLARVGLGIAGSGVYHSAYTILTEFADTKYRSSLSILFSVSYPIGMLILSIIAYLIHPWRYLQLAISVPAFLLIIHYFVLDESPRWLISKGNLKKAYKIVFDKKLEYVPSPPASVVVGMSTITSTTTNTTPNTTNTTIDADNGPNKSHNKCSKKIIKLLKIGFTELINLYGPSRLRKRLLICHITWFVTALSYYAIALNGNNFAADLYVYVALTGLLEIPSYIIPTIMFKWLGRKAVSIILFFLAGIALLLILTIPQENTTAIIAVAMIGRTCISSVFAVIILHTAELFPTKLRNSAIGTNSTMSHVGSISAPYIVDLLGTIGWFIPTTICGVASIFAGLLVFLLPETKHWELKESVEEENHINR